MSANIEELVKKHLDRDGWTVKHSEIPVAIRNALSEQSEAFKGELQAYDGMVRELTKTVEDMRAAQSALMADVAKATQLLKNERDDEAYALLVKVLSSQQSVPVVGEPVAWVRKDQLQHVNMFGPALCHVYATEQPGTVALIEKPTHSIPAAELATLREKAAEADDLRKDAERYRWIRDIAAGEPASAEFWPAIRLSIYKDADTEWEINSTLELPIDAAIDAAIAQGKGE